VTGTASLPPVGVLGGTFDPVHNGHLRLAQECLESLKLAEVRLIPVHSPPHRAPPIASPAQRLRMVEIAVRGASGLVADGRELQRGGSSYTIETLEPLRREAGTRPLCLLMGMDAFRQINTWRRWTALLDYAHIIVVDRPGKEPRFDDREVAKLFVEHAAPGPDALHASPAGRILKLNAPLLDVSATRIRELIATGRDPRGLLPDGVIDYIMREKLYMGGA
jgi:nicotinate-nucleotide adenylyltransferase